jgi:hypothetical protein
MSFPMPEATRRALQINRLGNHARRLLDSGQALHVFARFERSLYVADGGGRLACVGGQRLGDGPLNILLGIDSFDASEFHDGDRLAFDHADATTWRPPAFTAPGREGRKRGLAVADQALLRVPPRGMAAHHGTDRAVLRAQAGLAALATWLAAGAGDDVPAAVADILGLGSGLTPAGDDALGGAMIALRQFGVAEIADRLARDVLVLAPDRTSTISLAHLRAAAEGEGASALHQALAAIAGADADSLTDALQRLDRIGHSSGWDALAGALAALRAID